ncbi:hypothetical protein H6P81_008733 [Aristolochia fimbriata]|uniref:Uncharacterized protein n=1 Tax=Aristolochia fimbriata TaxID=158543 RepID=A0AAV7EJ22_ARIFI|nr:hypothetical protein H6P81_008733 [Aristolochia fimbriata]
MKRPSRVLVFLAFILLAVFLSDQLAEAVAADAADAAANAVHPQECPCCKWERKTFLLCTMICCKT